MKTTRVKFPPAAALLSIAFIAYTLFWIYRASVVISGVRYYYLFEDAMISMRYAWNFAHGMGLVWNAGERVEGFTNPLMVFVMIIPSFLFNQEHAVLAIQLLGIVFVLIVAWQASRLVPFFTQADSDVPRLIVFAATLFYYPLVYWSIGGMETGLLAVALSAAVALCAKADRDRSPITCFWAGVALSCMCLTRPESVLTVGFCSLFIASGLRSAGMKPLLRNVAALCLPVACTIGVELLIRWHYYHQLAPNTYYLKLAGIPLSDRLRNGVRFAWRFVVFGAPLIALSTACALYLRSRLAALVVGLLLMSICYQVYVGGDPWMLWRIMTPNVPLAVAVCAGGVAEYLSRRDARGQRVPLGWPAATACLVALAFLPNIKSFWRGQFFFNHPYQAAYERLLYRAISLRKITRPDARIGVVCAGILPYYLDPRPCIDYLGKMDPVIARVPPDMSGVFGFNGMYSVPGHNRYNLHYSIEQLQPDVTEAISYARDNVQSWAQLRYLKVRVDGWPFLVKKDSKAILWDRVGPPEAWDPLEDPYAQEHPIFKNAPAAR